MTIEYLTVADDAEAEIEVKRSRFLAAACRVESQEAAREVVEEARRRHWNARHHCSAFVLGPDGSLARSSDDGEPAGTAGAPILRSVRAHEVSDVVVVVTRWFGGVLLGAGGLARAYGEAATAALDASGRLRRELMLEVGIHSPIADAPRLENLVRSQGFSVQGTEYGPDGREAELRVAIPTPRLPELQSFVDTHSHGRAIVHPGGERWVDSSSLR
ncbi:MAG: IMPACT family protein [Actinomycetales bacterium]